MLAAPCCHHDIAAQLRKAPTPAPYAMLTRHGILRERFADTLTDALRASLMRLAGLPRRRRAVRREPAHAAQHAAARGAHRRPGHGRRRAQGVRRPGRRLGRSGPRLAELLERRGCAEPRCSPASLVVPVRCSACGRRPRDRRRTSVFTFQRPRDRRVQRPGGRRTGWSSPPTTPATPAGSSPSTRRPARPSASPTGPTTRPTSRRWPRPGRARSGSATSATTRAVARLDRGRPGAGRARRPRPSTPRRTTLAYPDGAAQRRDAAGATRATGRLYVATKGVFGGRLYAAPAQLDPRPAPTGCAPVGDVLPIATDGAFFPDGRHVVLRDYSAAVVYSFPDLEQVGALRAARPGAGRGPRGRRRRRAAASAPRAQDSDGAAGAGCRRRCARRWRRGRRSPPVTEPSPAAPAHRLPRGPRAARGHRDRARRRGRGSSTGWVGGRRRAGAALAAAALPTRWLASRRRASWLPARHAPPAQDLARPAGLDPPPGRARASSTSTSTATGCRAEDAAAGARPGHPAGVAATSGSRRTPNGHLQAVGTDDAGRRQYLYHPRLARPGATRRSSTGCCEFGKALAKARELVLTDLGARGDAAGAGLRGRRTAARPRLLPDRQRRLRRRATAASGSPRSSAGTCAGTRTGWSSPSSASPASSTSIEIDDPVVDRGARGDAPPARRRPAAARLQGRAGPGARCCPSWSTTTSARATGLEATAKDFRTWHATVLAAAALAETAEPGETKASRKRAVAAAMKEVVVVPRQHPDAGALVVRRPAGGRGLRGGPDDRGGHPAHVRHPRRAAGGARAGHPAAAQGVVSAGAATGSIHHGMQANPRSPR